MELYLKIILDLHRNNKRSFSKRLIKVEDLLTGLTCASAS
jgi:hypothetical protein